MSVMAGFPWGIQVAITTPLLGSFVTVIVTSPVRGTSGAVTHTLWLAEVPQSVAACATPGPMKSIEARTASMTRTRTNQRGVLGFRIAHLSPVDDQGARFDLRRKSRTSASDRDAFRANDIID